MANCCRKCRKMVMMLLMVLSVLSWSTVVVTQSHFQPCPDQWSRDNRSCYLLTSRAVTLQEASETCGLQQAHLVFVEGQEELDFVTGLMDMDTPSIWLGARYDRSRQNWVWSGDTGDKHAEVQFNKWTYGASSPDGDQYCSAIRKNGWWNFVTCSETLPFLCEKPRPCVAGWYGGDCDVQCHCLDSDPCRKEDGVCPRGCSPGWSGASCTEANLLPEASFHCLRTRDNDLLAEITMDVKGRLYRVIQAVSQDGEPLPSCTLPKVRQRAYKVFITLTLQGAFAAEDELNNTDSSGNNVTAEAEMTSEASATTSSLPEVTAAAANESFNNDTGSSGNNVTKIEVTSEASATSSFPVTAAATNESVQSTGAMGRGDESVSSATAGYDDSGVDNSTAVDDDVDDGDNGTVSVTASYDEATETAKRDVNSGDHVVKADSGEACVASRSENGTVTWLIEFKEYPDVLTGNDVTVEVTCNMDEADSLDFVDSVVDNSETAVPMEAARVPLMTSVYLTDHLTGQPADHFHLGQRLRLHVDVKGLTENECAFPHSCVVRPRGTQGPEVPILDQQGCGTPSSPVGQLRAEPRRKGQFTSTDFPAFSLGSSAVELECQVHVEPTSSASQCQTSCRSV